MGKGSRPKISTIVFDLDDTLYDCYRQRVPEANRYACRQLLKAGLRRRGGRRLTAESLLRLRRKLFRQDPDLETLDYRLCRSLGLEEAAARRLAQTGRHAYFSSPVGPLRLFADTLPTLCRLHVAGVRIFILTAGNRRIQQAKTRRLRLDRSPYIQRIFYTGLMRGRGKKDCLRQIIRMPGAKKEILVVGDRPDSEIRAANALGLLTVRRRGGEFAQRPAGSKIARADFSIRRLSELFGLPLEFVGSRRT